MTLSNQSNFPGFLLSPECHLIGFCKSYKMASAIPACPKPELIGIFNWLSEDWKIPENNFGWTKSSQKSWNSLIFLIWNRTALPKLQPFQTNFPPQKWPKYYIMLDNWHSKDLKLASTCCQCQVDKSSFGNRRVRTSNADKKLGENFKVGIWIGLYCNSSRVINHNNSVRQILCCWTVPLRFPLL